MRQLGVAPLAREGALLERTEALSTLDESLRQVERTSHGQVVLIAGEAGIGKTALLRRFCERRASGGLLWGACDPLFTPRPLGPLLGVAEEAGELERVVGTGGMPHEVVAALARNLRAHPGTVFVLEDVHWADEATLDVLRLLSRRIDSVPALVLASYRDDELDRRHPVRVVLGELAASHAVRRLKLAPLSRAAVAELAEPHVVDADELYRKTAGNPFFVVEALAAGAEEIPETVREAVLARAARLDDAARTLLEAVAVVPPQAELWLLEALAGEAVGSLDACLASGMLTAEPGGVAFRHELARLAVEESVAPDRRQRLHRLVLDALVGPRTRAVDLARLAHHAEAAGDADAVLRFAPAAAERAASLGAHREAVAQYARVLRFGARLSPSERAEVLERQARSCYLTDQYDAGIAALEEAVALRRGLGDRLKEADALRALSEFLWCPGRTEESERAARDAVAILEALPPSRELAQTYLSVGWSCAAAARSEEASEWSHRALELAERLGDDELAVDALAATGFAEGDDAGKRALEQALARARKAGSDEQIGGILTSLGNFVVAARDREAARLVAEGIDHCSDRGLELYRLYLLAYRSRLELYQGRWADAADSAAAVLRVPRTSTTPRIVALAVLALVRARRGDPEVWPLLDEAWALAEPTGELPRLGPVAAARAEVAWLEGDREGVAAATDSAAPLARERGDRSLLGAFAVWRRRAGLDVFDSNDVLEPYALELSADWAGAAERWRELGCPYDAALALANADEEPLLRQALDEFQRLEARPAAAIVARRLRALGVRGLPRGPRPSTRKNAARLTGRELEVLDLLAEGLQNREIADRLVLSTRTVDHHVAAILGKLGARTRAEASATATRLGIARPR